MTVSCSLVVICLESVDLLAYLLYLLFVRKKGYINIVPKSSVVRPSVRPSVTFLVIVSSPKPLEVATSNFVDA